MRRREEEEEEAGRRARELHRKQALEELQRFKRKSQAEVKEASDKENIPKKNAEDKKLPSFNTTKGVEVTDSSQMKVRHLQIDLLLSCALQEVVRDSLPSRQERSRMSLLESEDSEGPIYYGLGSAARRESKDLDSRVRDSYINDDLADEVEAIRLAADFSSRKLLSEQKRERRESLGVTPASASRMRIRAILDKQRTLKVNNDLDYLSGH